VSLQNTKVQGHRWQKAKGERVMGQGQILWGCEVKSRSEMVEVSVLPARPILQMPVATADAQGRNITGAGGHFSEGPECGFRRVRASRE
jgi:hypothetical protein